MMNDRTNGRTRPSGAISSALALAVTVVVVSFASSACGDRVSIGAIIEGPGTPTVDGGGDGAKPSPSDDAGSSTDAADGAAYQPCAAKSCGDPCSICSPADSSCVETAILKLCDEQGACSQSTAACALDGGGAYVPCAGKVCGQACTLCSPTDVGCVEPAVLKQCTMAGVCASSPVGC